MVAGVAQELSQRVPGRFTGRGRPRHAVRLVHNHQIPVHLFQAGKDFAALREVKRRQDLLLFEPLVDTELITDVISLDDQEFLVELFLQFSLPLERQVRRADDKDALGEAAELEFPDQEARHDSLAGSGVVGQQKSHPCEFEKVVVDGFQLMGERIDARDRKREIGVEFVGYSQRVSLQAQAEQLRVTQERRRGVEDRQRCQISGCQCDVPKALALRADESDRPGVGSGGPNGFDAHRLAKQRADQDISNLN